MEKLWKGRTSGKIDSGADDFNSSVRFDGRMYKSDIKGSLAHVKMLSEQGIISEDDCAEITAGLSGILSDMESGKLEIDACAEDIHSFIEAELTERIGEAGKRLHTARSRNDQVALDLRLYLRDEIDGIKNQIKSLISVIISQAKKNETTIMPGYTHMQRAQPVTFAQHMLAYSQMFIRDIGRLSDAEKRMNFSPLGACALAGTTYNTDREMTAAALGFDGVCENSMDAVSDRDYCVELLSALSVIMMHLSRFSEEIILWAGWEFGFITLDDAYTTGSSIMPQKKNPDMAELVRGKTGRVYGSLMGTLTMLKGLPLAYNKDMQEDKEAIFDAVDTVRQCLSVFTPMLDTLKTKPGKMYAAAQTGFINATDLADYLTRRGMPFREAYKTVGAIVEFCSENGFVLDNLPLEEYKKYSSLFADDLYGEISLESCVKKRISQGGTGYDSVKAQIKSVEKFLCEN